MPLLPKTHPLLPLCIMLLLAFAAHGQEEQEYIADTVTVDCGDSINVMDLGYLTDKLRIDMNLGYKVPKEIDPYVETEEFQSSNKSFWVALVLDMLGIGFVTYGYAKNVEASDRLNEYNSLNRSSGSEFGSTWKKFADAKYARNTCYILGGVFLASGIGVHIWF